MKLILIILLLPFTSSFGQPSKPIKSNSFSLKGKVFGRDTGRIILSYINSEENWVLDTTYLQNGRFLFQGNIKEPTYAGIKGYPKVIDFDEANYVGVFLEPTKQSISLTENNYKDAKMKGSLSEMEYDSLKMKFDSIDLKWKSINDEYLCVKRNLINHGNADSALTIKLNRIRDTLKFRISEIQSSGILFIAHHPKSYVSAYFLGVYLHKISIDSAKALYHKLNTEVKNSRYGLWDKKEINKIEQNSVGGIASDFSGKDVNGKEISLKRFKGKVVLLDFWASWCSPCREQMPLLKKLYNQYHNKGFEIIAISLDKDSLAWRRTIETETIKNWCNLLVNQCITNKYPNTTQPIPSEILIDRSGKIIWVSSHNNIKIELQGILNNQFN